MTNGADVNCSNLDRATPLHMAIAAEKNALDTVAFLIDAGADVNKGVDCGFSPLLLAVVKGDDINMLLDAGAMLLKESLPVKLYR